MPHEPAAAGHKKICKNGYALMQGRRLNSNSIVIATVTGFITTFCVNELMMDQLVVADGVS